MNGFHRLWVALLPSLSLLVACDRGPSEEELAAARSACEPQFAEWQRKQGSLGAAYDASSHYDPKSKRCLAHVRGGEVEGSRYESVVDVQTNHVVAGCSEIRAAMGDTPCQVNGEPASEAAGRMTIDRLTGRR